MKKSLLKLLPLVDILLIPVVYLSAWVLKFVRRAGTHRMPVSKSLLRNVGVFPVLNHYYEPQFDFSTDTVDFDRDRNLTGIDWNVTDQLNTLEQLSFSGELADLATKKPTELAFYLGNGSFESGDAEYWYQIIRHAKPNKIIEIGSGNSTLMARRALDQNKVESAGYDCEHICIEPYEMPWLEQAGVSVLREKVESLDLSYFEQLQANDILFIDSSHMIRPEGDVLFEYLTLLPSLNVGVIVHIHDIFSPKNYPAVWLENEVKFWNEQYLLEAFLTHNTDWKIFGALNYLQNNHYQKFKVVAPFVTPDRSPGSFYIQKVA